MKSSKYIFLFLFIFIITDQLGGWLLLSGINRFYGLKQHSDALIIGHSHLMLATDKNEIEKQTGLTVSKYTREGVNLADRLEMTKQYLNSSYSDSLKIVLFAVDLYSFTPSGLSENSYKLFYPFMGDSVIDAYIKNQVQDKQDYYSHKYFTLTRYSDQLINASVRGWRNDFSNYKLGTIDIGAFKSSVNEGKNHFARPIMMDQELITTFERTMHLFEQHHIRVVLINPPTVDVLNEADIEGYRKMMSFFQEYSNSHQNIEFWDLSPDFSSNYSLFYDPIHLNPKGQKEVSAEIINRLNQIKSIKND